MGCDISFLKKAKALSLEGGSEGFLEKRILFLGLDNAGKTSILFQMRDKEFKQSVPTVGLNIEHIKYKRYSMTLWDVGGQATKLWKHYFDHINGMLFVIDSTDEEKLLFAREELSKIAKDESLKGVPVMLFYNKSDMVEEVKSKEHLNEKLEIKAISQEREIGVQECSALTGEGIWEGIDKLIEMFEERQNREKPENDINASTNKDSKP